MAQIWTKVEVEHIRLPGGTIRRGRPLSATNFLYLMHGQAEVTWPETGHDRWREGHYIWIPSGMPVGVTSKRPSEIMVVRLRAAVWGAQASGDREAVGLIRRFDGVVRADSPVLKITKAGREKIADHLTGMHELYQQPELPYYRCGLKGKAMELLCLLAGDRRLSRQEGSTVVDDHRQRAIERVGAALDHMNKREYISRTDLRVEDLARLCGYKVSRFHKIFVEATGTTPQRYLTERRIVYACDFLRQPQFSILEVAFTSGFNTQSRFYAAFKQVTGQTPGEWRKAQAITDDDDDHA